MLYDGDTPVEALTFDRMDELEQEGLIIFPSVSQEEIRDKEKGGAFAKALVVLQTSWFVIQSIARVIQGLGLAELELFTLATAALNGFMYFLWWQKPLDVSYPIPVYFAPPSESESPPNSEMDPQASSSGDKEMEYRITPEVRQSGTDTDEVGEKPIHDESPTVEEVTRTFTLLPVNISLPPPSLRSNLTANSNYPTEVDHSFRAQVKAFLRNLRADIEKHGIPLSLCIWFLYRPFILPVTQLVGQGDELVSGKMRVATFYAPHTEDSNSPWPKLFLLGLSAIFGGLHCAAWSFYFPSRIERILWRSGSVIITAVPFLVVTQEFLTTLLLLNFLRTRSKSTVGRTIVFLMTVYTGFPLFLVVVYVIARFLLLFQCLFLLRDLPPKAFQSIEWTYFIPHL